MFDGQKALEGATVANDEDQQALFTAQETAENAYVTAARFLDPADPSRIPSADDVAKVLAVTDGSTAPEDVDTEPVDDVAADVTPEIVP